MIHTIDTRRGTDNQYTFSDGNTLPYTDVPFDMNYFCPQTNYQKGSWWFHPNDRIFQGYCLTHQPSPWMGDFSHFILTPISGSISELSLFHSQSSYRPEESVFQPTHLQITQTRYQLTSKLIPSMYGGILEMNYQQKNTGLLLTVPGKASSYLQIDDYTLQLTIINFAGPEDPEFSFYVTLHFAQPITELESRISHDQTLIRLGFGNVKQQIVYLGTSFINSELAELNYLREKEQDASLFLSQSQTLWNKYFNRIQVEHHNPKHTETFYHNLYRIFLFPQTFYEIDEHRKQIHYDTTSRTVKSGILYTNNGFWDTYKTVYPLYSLITKEKYEEMFEDFLNSYYETDFLPKWLSPDERGLMPGTLIDAVIADAAVKNIRLDLMDEF